MRELRLNSDGLRLEDADRPLSGEGEGHLNKPNSAGSRERRGTASKSPHVPAHDKTATSRAPGGIPSSPRATAALWMLGLLGVEFLVGMGVNFYVELPSGGMTQMMRGGGANPLLMVHMMLGMTLGVGAVLTLWFARRYGRWPIVCATVALAGIVGAGIAGMVFAVGGQNDVASFLMAVGFLVALAGYIAELVTITNAAPAVPAVAGRQR
jgi:hypothetical protein